MAIPKFASNYALSVSIPHWLSQLDFEIYEYTGDVIDTNEQKLEQIIADLQTYITGSNGSLDGSEGALTVEQQGIITYFTNFI